MGKISAFCGRIVEPAPLQANWPKMSEIGMGHKVKYPTKIMVWSSPATAFRLRAA